MADEYYDFYNPSESDVGSNYYSGLGDYNYYTSDPYSAYYGGSSGNTGSSSTAYSTASPYSTSNLLSSLSPLLSSLLGTGLSSLGKSTSSTPTTSTATSTSQTPLTTESQQYAGAMANLLPYLYGSMDLNQAQQNVYNQVVGTGLESYLNPISSEYTNALKGLINPTQQAIEASTSQALNRMAPNALSLGPQVQNIISEVSKANVAEREFANQIYKYLSDQAMTANTGYGTRAGTAMQLAGAPQTQQLSGVNNLSNLLSQLINISQGGAATSQAGTGTQVTQPVSFTSNLLTGTGSSLLNNTNALGSILQLLGLS